MKSSQVPSSNSRRRQQVPAELREVRYATHEEQVACCHNTATPYFRLEDSLCKRYLAAASDPFEFPGLSLLFPFVREASAFQVRRAADNLHGWMSFAFLSGYDLGRRYPDRLDDVLRGRELGEALRRLGVIKLCSGEDHFTPDSLNRACREIVKRQWPDVPKGRLECVLVEAVVKSLRTGFAAATAAHCDPAHCEYVWDIPDHASDAFNDIFVRAWLHAPINAVGLPVARLLEHPLIKIARELYPNRAVERDTMLAFFNHQLASLDVRSENECPASGADLLEWIARGLEYGRRVKAERPATINAIFREAGEAAVKQALRSVQSVVQRAGLTVRPRTYNEWRRSLVYPRKLADPVEPLRLIGPLKQWQENLYGWSEPSCYGEALARVAYFSDFAIWIPWACD